VAELLEVAQLARSLARFGLLHFPQVIE